MYLQYSSGFSLPQNTATICNELLLTMLNLCILTKKLKQRYQYTAHRRQRNQRIYLLCMPKATFPCRLILAVRRWKRWPRKFSLNDSTNKKLLHMLADQWCNRSKVSSLHLAPCIQGNRIYFLTGQVK